MKPFKSLFCILMALMLLCCSAFSESGVIDIDDSFADDEVITESEAAPSDDTVVLLDGIRVQRSGGEETSLDDLTLRLALRDEPKFGIALQLNRGTEEKLCAMAFADAEAGKSYVQLPASELLRLNSVTELLPLLPPKFAAFARALPEIDPSVTERIDDLLDEHGMALMMEFAALAEEMEEAMISEEGTYDFDGTGAVAATHSVETMLPQQTVRFAALLMRTAAILGEADDETVLTRLNEQLAAIGLPGDNPSGMDALTLLLGDVDVEFDGWQTEDREKQFIAVTVHTGNELTAAFRVTQIDFTTLTAGIRIGGTEFTMTDISEDSFRWNVMLNGADTLNISGSAKVLTDAPQLPAFPDAASAKDFPTDETARATLMQSAWDALTAAVPELIP